MTNEFTREARYAVLKSADVMQCLTVSELIELQRIQAKVEEHRAEIGKPPLDCVVVESDWPEYAPTWRAIEARVTGAEQPTSHAFDDSATIAGLESAVSHLSACLDEFRALLVEVNDVCGRDGHGGPLEEGESEIIDKVRAALSMRTEARPQEPKEICK
ncbi:hypothetical protein p1B283 (plasmid) [Aromatoleum aromaticum EbN1]|jgi:hypothetical protein|uniref:Uncharacterized protein n=1 Tax=Aromatoleum aromaticum (strain DSM 19018 / LMG 30748 / EbN1) TaxID=76114 RepID=Q5NWU8_AROAE|nr:hypothetical protein [Aromatoleum aromaticum]CAI10466.1 hypothetical protein p1B283 [Aromatoleum aromaticum EbN1]